MEVVEDFVHKHASASFKTCADEPLVHQFKDLLKQCELHNNVKCKVTSKKAKKSKIANFLSMLLRMREISEQKEIQWYTEKTQLKDGIDNVTKSIVAIAANVDSNGCECVELRKEVDQLTEENGALEERLNKCEQRGRLREQYIASLEQFQESCRLKQTLGGEVQDLKVEIERLKSLVQQTAEVSVQYKRIVEYNGELSSKNHSHCLAQVETLQEQLGSHNAVVAAVSVSGVEGKACDLERPGKGVVLDADTESGIEMAHSSDPSDVSDSGLSSDEDSVGSEVNIVPQSELPCAQVRAWSTRPALRCFACKRIGHIARYCVVANGNMRRSSKYPRTASRKTEVYSPRWGSFPRHGLLPGHRSQELPKSRTRVEDLKAQNELLEQENKELKDERDRFWEQLRTKNFVYQTRGN